MIMENVELVAGGEASERGRKDLWSVEETQLLNSLVETHGQRWVKICKQLPGRTPEQCSAKFYRTNHDRIETAAWTDAENKILEDAYTIYGGKWAAISKLLPGRTDKAVRNRYMRMQKNIEIQEAQDSKKREFLQSLGGDLAANIAAVSGVHKRVRSSATGLSSSSDVAAATVSSLDASADQMMASTMDVSGSDSDDDDDDALVAAGRLQVSTRLPSGNAAFALPMRTKQFVADNPGWKYNRSKWEPHEDAELLASVAKNGSEDWHLVRKDMNTNRTALQCADRYKGYLSPDHRRGMWTKEENLKLLELVEKHGLHSWMEVARGLPGRTAKQCNAKWFRCLDPNINRNRWSNEENAILKHGHATFGSKWAELARMLPGRTDKSVRNHWICSLNYARQALLATAVDRDEGRRGKEAYNYLDFTEAELDAIAAGREFSVHSSAQEAAAAAAADTPNNPASSAAAVGADGDATNKPATGIQKAAARKPVAQWNKHWTLEEDARLVELVNENGFRWALIAQEFNGLHPRKQCRDRYLYQLKKDTARNPWTDDEIKTLLVAQHQAGGNKWVEFNKLIPTHTENSVRNYWRAFLRGVTEQFLSEQGRINKDALVSNYNFDQIYVNLLLTDADFDAIVAYVRTHLADPTNAANAAASIAAGSVRKAKVATGSSSSSSTSNGNNNGGNNVASVLVTNSSNGSNGTGDSQPQQQQQQQHNGSGLMQSIGDTIQSFGRYFGASDQDGDSDDSDDDNGDNNGNEGGEGQQQGAQGLKPGGGDSDQQKQQGQQEGVPMQVTNTTGCAVAAAALEVEEDGGSERN